MENINLANLLIKYRNETDIPTLYKELLCTIKVLGFILRKFTKISESSFEIPAANNNINVTNDDATVLHCDFINSVL